MKKQTARRNICSHSSSDGIFIIIFFTFIAYVLLWPGPLLAAALFATSRNCSALAIFFLVIKLVTLLSCSSCIGCWLMEDSIMAPILNFYGTSPRKEPPEEKGGRKRRANGDRAGKTSRLSYDPDEGEKNALEQSISFRRSINISLLAAHFSARNYECCDGDAVCFLWPSSSSYLSGVACERRSNSSPARKG
jgi:hypothetical protein